MSKFIPTMVTLAREARGMTQAELAAAASISPSKVSKYEAGALAVSEEDAAEIARVLRYPPAFFCEPFMRAADTSHIFHHRKKASVGIGKTREIHARADACRLHLQRLLTDVAMESPGFVSMDIDAFDGDVERIATLVRASWGLPAGPIPNMVEAVEQAGAIVVMCDFGTRDLDALSQFTPCFPPVIFLNSSMPVDRQRLSLGHEVAHLIMHRVPISTDPEREANAFAGAMLLPESEFRADVGDRVTLNHLLALKPRWKVSVQAMVFRARQLEMISERQYRDLFMRMGAMGWRRAEPLPLAPERPRLVQQIIDLHAREHGLSIGDLSGMARMLEDDFRSTFMSEPKSGRVLRGPSFPGRSSSSRGAQTPGDPGGL